MPSLLFQIEQTTAQSLANNVNVQATYNSILSNTAQVVWSPSGFTNMAQITLEGNYVITAQVGMGTNTTGIRSMNIQVTSIYAPTDWHIITGMTMSAAPTGQKNLQCSALFHMNVGNLVQVTYIQNSGAALNTTTMSVANGTPNATLSLALVY